MGPFDGIRLILFSHRVDSAGLASVSDWRAVLDRAGKAGAFSGVDVRRYPKRRETGWAA